MLNRALCSFNCSLCYWKRTFHLVSTTWELGGGSVGGEGNTESHLSQEEERGCLEAIFPHGGRVDRDHRHGSDLGELEILLHQLKVDKRTKEFAKQHLIRSIKIEIGLVKMILVDVLFFNTAGKRMYHEILQ